MDGPASASRTVSACYPYTALVGAEELGYDDERPKYKRKPPLAVNECGQSGLGTATSSSAGWADSTRPRLRWTSAVTPRPAS
jgi:hypothetical protein